MLPIPLQNSSLNHIDEVIGIPQVALGPSLWRGCTEGAMVTGCEIPTWRCAYDVLLSYHEHSWEVAYHTPLCFMELAVCLWASSDMASRRLRSRCHDTRLRGYSFSSLIILIAIDCFQAPRGPTQALDLWGAHSDPIYSSASRRPK